MKRLILSLLLFSSPVLAEKDRIYYVHARPPSSYSGTIGDDGFFYYFTNSADCFNDEIIKMKINGACFVKTNVPAKIIRKGIMNAGGRYWFNSCKYWCYFKKGYQLPIWRLYERYSRIDSK